MQSIPLGGTIPIEPDKIGFIVFGNNLLYETVFCLAHFSVTSFPNEHDKVFQKPDFLHVQLLSLDAKRIHSDRIFLGVTDIFATDIFTESFIRVTCIDHNDIGILLPKLSDDTVHMEVFWIIANCCKSAHNKKCPKLNGTKKCNSKKWEI